MGNRKFFVMLLLFILVLMGCSDSNSIAKVHSKEKSKLNYPTKPVKFIVPYAAGGSTDVIARGMAEYAPKYLGEPLIIENTPGAAGVVGTTEGVHANNDGYTMTMAAAGVFSAVPHSTNLTFTLDDVETLISFHNVANVLIAKADSPYQTVNDLVEATDSGEKIFYGNSGAGNLGHLALETFFDELKGEHSYIPYEGSAPAIAAVLGEHIDVAVVHPPEVKSHLEEGSVKILGIFGPERLTKYPEIPTIGEALKESDIDYAYASHDFAVWMFGVVPEGTPPEVVEYLTKALRETLQDENFIDFTEKTNFDIKIMDREEINNRVKQDYEVYKEIISIMNE